MDNFSNINYLKSELKKITHHFELKDFDYVIQKSIILSNKLPKQKYANHKNKFHFKIRPSNNKDQKSLAF